MSKTGTSFEFGLVNKKTGEVFDAELRITRQKQLGGKWVKVFQDGKRELMRRSPGLQGQSYRILHYLEAVVAWGNMIPYPSQLATDLHLHASHASRAYGELRKAGFIIKRDRCWYLSPLVCWKGSAKELAEAYRQLEEPIPKLLPPKNP